VAAALRGTSVVPAGMYVALILYVPGLSVSLHPAQGCHCHTSQPERQLLRRNLTEFAAAESTLRAALGEVEYERKHRLGETLPLHAVVDLLLHSRP
jgi:hypothetical protein